MYGGNTALRMGSHAKYSTWVCLALHLSLAPTPRAVFLHITRNSALTTVWLEILTWNLI